MRTLLMVVLLLVGGCASTPRPLPFTPCIDLCISHHVEYTFGEERRDDADLWCRGYCTGTEEQFDGVMDFGDR